jgi:hypothetical protein
MLSPIILVLALAPQCSAVTVGDLSTLAWRYRSQPSVILPPHRALLPNAFARRISFGLLRSTLRSLSPQEVCPSVCSQKISHTCTFGTAPRARSTAYATCRPDGIAISMPPCPHMPHTCSPIFVFLVCCRDAGKHTQHKTHTTHTHTSQHTHNTHNSHTTPLPARFRIYPCRALESTKTQIIVSCLMCPTCVTRRL